MWIRNHRFPRLASLIFLSLLFAGTAAGFDRKPDAIRALIVTGIDYPGHHWWKATPSLKEELG